MSEFSADIHLASEAFKGHVTWSSVAATVEAQAVAWVKGDPTATALAGAALSTVKQGLSDAIGQAETALAAHQAVIAVATETVLEATLAAITAGKSLPFNPIITDGIDKLVTAAIAAAQTWGLQVKAHLAAPATPPTPGS